MRAKTLITMTALAAAAGCDSSTGPSELDRARVLAVQVDPPHLGPEETAPVDLLIGTADGVVEVVAPASMEVLGAPPGSPTASMIGHSSAGWAVACPDAPALAALRAELGIAADQPIPVPLAIEVDIDGERLTATKYVYLGSQGENPQLAGITMAGAVEADGVMLVSTGDQIAIAADRAAGEGELSYAWFTSVGDIDLYLSEEATLTAEGPADGQVVLVVRDDSGGVTWAWRDVRVD